MKRIIAIVTAAVIMLSMIPVVNASSVVNYSVYALAADPYSNTYTSTLFGTSVNYAVNRPSTVGQYTVGGYSVLIPSNDVGGYLLVIGYYPILTTVTGTSSGWRTGTVTNFSGFERLFPYYFFADGIASPGYGNANSGLNDQPYGEPFTGLVYVPAHQSSLYLNVYGYSLNQNATSTSAYGAYHTQTASIQFIPDVPSGPDYSSLLQSILSALNSMNANQSGFEAQLSQILSALSSILSALQSSGGDVSDIASALNDVNSKLQSTLDQITSSGADNEYTQQVLDDMDQLMDKIDDLTQQIEDNTNRPPPEDIVPSIPPQLLPPTDETAIAGRDAISGILSSSFFVTFLLMVFSLAFLRYVLFGKSK